MSTTGGTLPSLKYASAAGRWVIAATVLGSGMAAIDATVVGIAVPTIGRDFHATLGTLQWVVTGYALTLAALLLLGGSLGDRYGRRLVFCVGVVWFALSSAACGFAPNSSFLIGARVVQGVGAAMLTPGSLAILQASFSPEDRGRAIGAWSGLGGVASAAGPLLGGYLILAASWRWIFFINLPVGVLVLVLSVRHVPESKGAAVSGPVDVPGAFVAVASLAAVTYGLIEGPERGFSSPLILGMLAAGVLGAVVFVLVERASAAPMLPLGLFGSRQFSVTNGVTFLVYAALGGALFLIPVELQIVNGYTPLQSGLALLPLTGVMLALSAQSGRLATKIGPRLQMGTGPVVVGAGLALMVRSTTSSSYLTGVLPAVALFALGLAITVAPLTATALGAAPADHAGVASAVNNYVARVGSLLAVAVLPELSGVSGSSYLHAHLLAAGFRRAMLITACVCAAGGLMAALGITNPTRASEPTPRDGPVPGDGVSGQTHPERVHCALDAPPLGADS